MTEYVAFHAYITPSADEALSFISEETSVSKTGLVEIWLQGLRLQLQQLDWSEESAETVMGADFLKAARRTDAARRRRVRK